MYAALTHGLTSKSSYLSRTVPSIGDLFLPVEKGVRHDPVLLSMEEVPFNQERELLALPIRMDGLGNFDSTRSASNLLKVLSK